MSLVEVKVPDIGDFDEVAVIELLVKPGETIKAEQSLITVESDKASMEIPSTHAGVVKELKVKIGDKVSEGSLLLMVEAEGGQGTPPARAEPVEAPAPSSAGTSASSVRTEAAAPPPGPSAGSGRTESVVVVVPDIGDFDEVAVIEVLVKPGDTVKGEQSLVTVESDKASMEIPSSHAGVVKEVKVKVGDKVKKGTPLAVVEAAGAAAPAPAAPSAPSAPAQKQDSPSEVSTPAPTEK